MGVTDETFIDCVSFHIVFELLFLTGFSIEELFAQIQWNHLVGIMIFIWASIHQHMCHVILANLRKGDSGESNYLLFKRDTQKHIQHLLQGKLKSTVSHKHVLLYV